MTTFRRIIAILDLAVGGPSAFVGAHGAFWRGVTRDQFVQKKVFGQPLVVIGNGAGSNLVQALKGKSRSVRTSGRQAPAFDGCRPGGHL